MEYREANSKDDLDRWARALGVRVHIVDETWDCVYFQADAEHADGTHLRCCYRYILPRRLALRRRERTFVVGFSHTVDGAMCCHVRPIIAGLSAGSEADAMSQAVIYASALVELQCRPVCGASSTNLAPYVITRASSWNLVSR